MAGLNGREPIRCATNAALAAALGLGRSAVGKAVAAGRIARESDGFFNVERAREQLVGTSARPDVTLKETAPRIEVVRQGRPPGKGASGRRPSAAQSASSARLIAARARSVELANQERELRLRRTTGELIDRAKTVAYCFRLARQERDSWLGWPPRVAAMMAAELGVHPHAMLQMLQREVEAHLRSMHEIKVDPPRR